MNNKNISIIAKISFNIVILLLFVAVMLPVFAQVSESPEPEGDSESSSADSQSISSESAFRFAVIGDMQVGCKGLTDTQEKALDKLVKEVRPSFVIQLGNIIDVRSSGENSKEDCIKNMWSFVEEKIVDRITGKGMLFFTTQGRTDGNIGKNSAAKKLFSQFWSDNSGSNRDYPISGAGYGKYYSFDFGDSHFISLMAPGTKGLADKKKQLDWLKEDVANAKALGVKNIFTFSGSPLNAPATVSPSKKKTAYLQSSRELMAILKANGVRMHFGGNIHIFKDEAVEKIIDLIPGVLGGGRSGLASTGKPSDYSFVVVDVDGENIQYYVLKEPEFDASELPPTPTVSSPLQTPDVPDSLSGLGVCPAGMTPATTFLEGSLPVAACGGASSIPPPKFIDGETVLAYAHRYAGRPYSSTDPCGFVCTTLVDRVLKDLGVKVDSSVVNVRRTGEMKGKPITDMFVSDSHISSGVQKAVIDAGVGTVVSLEEAKPGDFMQRWKYENGEWKGHAIIIEEVLGDNRFKVFGAHNDKIGVSVATEKITKDMKVYLSRLNPDAGSGSSSNVEGFPPTFAEGSVRCVPDTSLTKMLYDIVIQYSSGVTNVTGIARQNLAVGINKMPQDLEAGTVCYAIKATKEYDLEYLKSTYGMSKMDVESQSRPVNFLGHSVKIHRLISPVLGCVEKDIMSCEAGKSYEYRTVEGFKWQAPSENPDLLATSSFGIAININSDTNNNAQTGELASDLPPCVIDAFKRYGFKWGGDNVESKQPNHFEFMADPSSILIRRGVLEPLGGEVILKCATGDCIVQMAEYFVKTYEKLPYIWGGESPYSYEQTKQDKEINPDSFFKGVSLSAVQPDGNSLRSGKPTVPGFDCSGFAWWVFKHAGIPGFSNRYGATKQRDQGIEKGGLIACNPSRNEILRLGKPGDLLFWNDRGEKVTVGTCTLSKIAPHVAIYAGDGYIMESGGSRENPPDIDYSEFFKTYNTDKKSKYGGLQKRKLPSDGYSALVRYAPDPEATANTFDASEFESKSSSKINV